MSPAVPHARLCQESSARSSGVATQNGWLLTGRRDVPPVFSDRAPRHHQRAPHLDRPHGSLAKLYFILHWTLERFRVGARVTFRQSRGSPSVRPSGTSRAPHRRRPRGSLAKLYFILHWTLVQRPTGTVDAATTVCSKSERILSKSLTSQIRGLQRPLFSCFFLLASSSFRRSARW